MREFLIALLPPWNLARLFSAYRILEAENAELRDRVDELEREKTDHFNYILMLRSAPPIVPKEKKPREMAALPQRAGLRGLRRRKLHGALLQMLRPDESEVRSQKSEVSGNGEMAARADEYAERVAGS